MPRKFLFTCVCLLAASVALGQQREPCSVTLVGRVIDSTTSGPLADATVRIANSDKGVTTLPDGRFALSNLCPQDLFIEVQFLGYKSKVIFIESNRLIIEWLILLEPSEILLGNIAISAPDLPPGSISKESISIDDISRGGGKSLGEVLSKINGVTTLKSGPGIAKPVIHGLHSNRILILNNGIRQEGQQWGSEHAPEIDPYIASKITVVKGAESVRYGSDAIGGLIVVGPPDLHRTKTIGGEFNTAYMTNSRMILTSGMLEGGLNKSDKIGWRVQGTYKKAGDSHAPDYNLTNTGIREVNFSAGMGYANDRLSVEAFYSHFYTELGILRSAHTGSRTDFLEAIARPQPLIIEPFSYRIDHPKQEVKHDLYKLNAHYDINPTSKLSLVYGSQRNNRLEFDRRRGQLFNVPGLDLTLTTHTLDAIWDMRHQETWTTSIGISGMAQMNRWDANTGKNPLIPWYNQGSLGLFAIQRYIKPRWEAEIGLRYDHKNLLVKAFNRSNELIEGRFNFDNTTLNAGAQYNISESVSINSHIGSAWRPPHVSEMLSNGIHHGTASYESGLLINDRDDIDRDFANIAPPSEVSYKWLTGISVRKDRLTAQVDGYLSNIDNFIYLNPVPGAFVLTSRGDFPLFRYDQINAFMHGVDASLNYKLTGQLQYQFKASAVRATDRRSKEAIIWIPADRLENSLQLSLPSIGKLEDFHMSVGSLMVMRQWRVASERDLTAPPPAYFLMNAHIGFELPIGERHVEFSLNIDNLLNTSYRDYMNRFRYFTDDLGRNFSISLKYNFHNHS